MQQQLWVLCNIVCKCKCLHYRDAVLRAVWSVSPGEGNILGNGAPGEEGAGQSDV